jgi:[ribosomal protein S18]-alanine N-acetyltransferase
VSAAESHSDKEEYASYFVALRPSHSALLAQIELQWNPRPWGAGVFSSQLALSSTVGRGILLHGHGLVGYILGHSCHDEAHIVSVAVQRAVQRLGFGRALVHRFLADTAIAGAGRVTLEVRPSNGAARSLYQSIGFSVCGIRKRYYSDNGEDALTMAYQYGNRNDPRSFLNRTE